MDPFQEHNPKQASHTKSTIEEVKEWDEDDLLKWIHQERPGLLKDNNLEKFKAAFINKNIFVDHAGDVGFFENKCKLPIGISESLAKLAREAAGGETAGIAQKGNRQQAEDVEMTDAVDMKTLRNVQDTFKAGIPYKSPRSLVKTSGKNWKFQPHPGLYKLLAPNVLEHYTQYKNDNVDKIYAPIYFYRGGAGTGKSRHGSEFASSVQEAIRLYAERHAELHTNNDHCDHCDLCDLYNELSQRLKNAFVFHVSFENGTSLIHEEKSNPWNAVGVRMLHQLLDESLKIIRGKYIAEPDDVFQLVAAAEKVDLYNDFTEILVIDGIHNASMRRDNEGMDKESVFYSFLNQISDLSLMSRDPPETGEGKMRKSPFIMTCVTATYFRPGHEFLAQTNGKRVYLPLNQLDMPT